MPAGRSLPFPHMRVSLSCSCWCCCCPALVLAAWPHLCFISQVVVPVSIHNTHAEPYLLQVTFYSTVGGLRERTGSPQNHPSMCMLISHLPTPSQWFSSHIPHLLHLLWVTFYRYWGWFGGHPRTTPLHTHLIYGHQLPPSDFHLTFCIPCTRCRSIFTGMVGGAQKRAGSPQIHPSCVLARFTPSIEVWILLETDRQDSWIARHDMTDDNKRKER